MSSPKRHKTTLLMVQQQSNPTNPKATIAQADESVGRREFCGTATPAIQPDNSGSNRTRAHRLPLVGFRLADPAEEVGSEGGFSVLADVEPFTLLGFGHSQGDD